MDESRVGKITCYTCGAALPAGRFPSTENGAARQCSRCVMVDALIEDLIRKQLREAHTPKMTLVTPSRSLSL
jgi:hypothetical protein